MRFSSTTVLALAAVVAVVLMASPVKADKCSECQVVVGFIEGWLAKNNSIAAIEADLQKACALIPGISAICTTLVDFGIPEVISWLENKETPNQVCTKLHLCVNTTGSSMKLPENLRHVKSVKKVQGGAECAGCTYVIGAMESWIDNQASEQQIEALLDNLCAIVPGFASTCDAIVQAGVPYVVSWIVQNENATTICSQLGVCDAARCSALKAPLDDCNECQTVIGAMEHWIAQNTSLAWIENLLENSLCKFVPAFETTCDQIVLIGIPTVVQWIETAENPQTVCQQIGLCTSSVAQKIAPKKVAKVELGDDCSDCQTLIGAIESWIAQNSTIAWMENVLENTVCKFVPAYESTCDAIAQYGLPQVIQWIETAENPQTVCQQIEICSSKAKVAHNHQVKKVNNLKDDCSECQTVVGAIEHWIATNTTIGRIDSLLEGYLCVLIPGWATTCDAIVEAGVPTVIEWIEAAEDPKTACTQLDLCSSSTNEWSRRSARKVFKGLFRKH